MKIFYLKKDINNLLSDKLINKIREQKIFLKKIKKAKAKKIKLNIQKPKLDLHLIIRERYISSLFSLFCTCC